MALHEKNKVRDFLLDDVYASSDLAISMPKYKFSPNEHDPRHVYQVVHDELMLDGNSRQNLATFCQTWVDPEIHRLMDECLDKNMIDKDEYPQTTEIEARCVHMLADLWNSPEAANTLGCSTTGSSEAAMLGGLTLKWKWREKMKAQGKTANPPAFSRWFMLLTGVLATTYAVWLLYAAGPKFLLLSLILFVLGIPVYWWSHREQQHRKQSGDEKGGKSK